MADSGRYVYAVARDVDPSTLRGARGIDDAALEIVSHQGLQAVVGDVSLAEFGEEPLRRNLEDLTWLERIARRHDEVVHAVSVSGATAPMRLATICLDDAGVRRRLEEWHDALSSALARLEGRSEWSVKVVVPAPQRTSTTAEALRASAPGAGAAYLRQKREEAEQRARDEAESAEHAEAVYERLSRGSVARRREHAGSDVDLLLLLEGPVQVSKEIRRSSGLVASLALETGLVLSVVPVSVEDYPASSDPYLINARTEGAIVSPAAG